MSSEDVRVCSRPPPPNCNRLRPSPDKGFRGEALASISAIAHVEVTTCQEGADVGTLVRCHGSELVGESPKARATGTTFHVKNLFYNVPARRNFLKSDAVEMRHVVDEFQRVAFAHPGIAFTLTHQNANLFQLKPGTLRQRIVGILGPKHDERLVPVNEDTDVVTIEGFVGKPDSARKSRGEQFLFVNGRFVKHGLLHRAVLRAYENLIAEGQHPLYALYLTVDPARIDVNIHPTKIEVKFDEEQPIIAILKSAVKRGLGAHNVAPTIDFDAEVGLNIPEVTPGMEVSEPVVRIDPSYNPFNAPVSRGGSAQGSSPSLGQAHGGWSKPDSSGWKDLYKVLDDSESNSEEADMSRQSLEDSGLEVLLWKGKYLMVPTQEGIAVVHIRRAHMRVQYERYLNNRFGSGPQSMPSQRLLMPEAITLSKAEVLALKDARETLAAMGMELSVVDDQTVELSAVPADLTAHVREALDAVLETFHDGHWDDHDERHRRWAQAWASRVAPKGEVTMPLALRRQLVADLWACEHPHSDPTGRPVMSVWTSKDLENPFR